MNNNSHTTVFMYNPDKTVVYYSYIFKNGRISTVREFGDGDGADGYGKYSNYMYSAAARQAQVYSYVSADANEGEVSNTRHTTVISFDDDGDVISEYLYVGAQDKTGIEGVGDGIHPYYGNGGISTIGTSNNLLMEHNFDGTTYWSMTEHDEDTFSCTRRYDEATAKYGKCVLVLDSSSGQCLEQGAQQTVYNVEAGEYTFSAYLRVTHEITATDNPGAYLRVIDASGNVLTESERLSVADKEYIRISASFELASKQNVTAQILMDGKGVAYVNAAQLEKGSCASDYNLILNGNFANLRNWTKTTGVQTSGSSYFSSPYALMVTGSLEEKRNASQIVPVFQKRSTRETFTLSGWAKGNGIPARERDGTPAPQFRLRAMVHYNDSDYEDTSDETFTADFSPCAEDGQHTSIQFAKSKYRQH